MKINLVLSLGLYSFLVSGCASNGSLSGNLYEGLKTRQSLVNQPVDQNPDKQSMSYQNYQHERSLLLKNSDPN